MGQNKNKKMEKAEIETTPVIRKRPQKLSRVRLFDGLGSFEQVVPSPGVFF